MKRFQLCGFYYLYFAFPEAFSVFFIISSDVLYANHTCNLAISELGAVFNMIIWLDPILFKRVLKIIIK